MRKRIISGILLACIIVPTFFWAKDMVTGSVSLKTLSRQLFDTTYKVKKDLLRLVSQSYVDEIANDEEQLASDIDAFEELITEMKGDGIDSERVDQLEGEVTKLIQRMDDSLFGRRSTQTQIDEERLKAEMYFLEKNRRDALRRELRQMVEIVELQNRLGKNKAHLVKSKAADVVNRFLDAVIENDVETARELANSSLKNSLDLPRIRRLRKSIPDQLFDGFELRDLGDWRLQVWAGEVVGTLSTSEETGWRFDTVWEE
ncbi:MAG: hypothetical protein MPJ24_06905 [Pirellulaceae bacterium]|nr:hypothetical protein [Pirellulaceae bacterium]